MNDMKIGVVLESPLIHESPLFRYLDTEESDVKVYYMSERGIDTFYDEKRASKITVDEEVIDGYESKILGNLSNTKNAEGFLSRTNIGIINELRNENLDALIVYGYQFATCWLAIVCGKVTGTPVFIRAETEDYFYRSTFKKVARDSVLRVLTGMIDAALSIGTYSKEFYLNHGLDEEKIFRVPYSLENDQFELEKAERRQARAELREDLGFDEDTTVFVMVSQHRPARHPMDAVKAFCKVPEETSAAMLITGNGPLRDDLESYAADHAEDGRIIFTGRVPESEYPGYLRAGDVLVHPSSEPWGCAINEAIAAGLAVISSDEVLGWRDMVKPGVNGLVYPFKDIETLSEQINFLSRSPNIMDEMKKKSKELAQERGPEKWAECVVNAVKDVI